MPTDEPRRPSARATALVTTLIDACEAIGRQQTWAMRSPGMAVKTEAGESARDFLLAYLADLEETVDWYADPAHYGDSAKRIITADGSFANVCSVLADGGARARAVPQ